MTAHHGCEHEFLGMKLIFGDYGKLRVHMNSQVNDTIESRPSGKLSDEMSPTPAGKNYLQLTSNRICCPQGGKKK